MKAEFFKFPATPHLAMLEGVEIRGDKVLSEAERLVFLRHEIVVEEKVDGANLGISFDSEGNLFLQNRGSHLKFPVTGQWKKLEQWLNPKIDALFESLTDRYILFGEWCYAKHSVYYNRLPDFFLGFDVYDKKVKKFFSTEKRDKFINKMGINRVPQIVTGNYSLSDIRQLLAQSKISDEPAEGLYLRINQGDWLLKRTKLVRSSFIQSVEEHWSRSVIKPNQLDLKIWGMSSD
ncbi:MAG: RNA ligase family protein [Candidatus Muiribacteriota bacterium]